MGPELLSVLVLVALFVLATTLPVNLGALALVAAFGVGVLALGLSVDDVVLGVPGENGITGGFPGDLFVLLVGLTYLFALAQANGTVDLVVGWSMRLVRGRAAGVPWVFFALSALLSAIGALFAVAIVAPLALPCARRFRIDPLLAGVLVVHGALGGAFSPITVYGAFVAETMAANGLPVDPVVLFVVPLVINTVAAGIAFTVLGGRRLIGRRVAVTSVGEDTRGESGGGAGRAPAHRAAGGMEQQASTPTSAVRVDGAEPRTTAANGSDQDGSTTGTPVGWEQLLTLAGLLALAVGSVAFGLDTGVLSLVIAVIVRLAATGRPDVVDKISWSTVLLICGVITYVGVLQLAGTITWAGAGIVALGAPLLVALLLCYLGGVLSAFASSVGILGVAIPLAVPFLQQGTIGAVGLVTAPAVASTIVDVSPFSSNGALVLASAAPEEREALTRRLLGYAGVVVAAGPLLAWLVLVVPGWW